MENKTTSTRARQTAAFTLVEVMVASALALVVLLVVCALSFYSSRSFAAMANYVNMDQTSQTALDKMSREIRQCRQLTSITPTSLAFTNVDYKPVQFVWDADTRSLVRIADGVTNTYLKNCDFLRFAPFQHTVQSNTFDCYGTLYLPDTKVIQVTWLCTNSILGIKANTESVLSAKVVIRNE